MSHLVGCLTEFLLANLFFQASWLSRAVAASLTGWLCHWLTGCATGSLTWLAAWLPRLAAAKIN
jgi:hypothetical protein